MGSVDGQPTAALFFGFTSALSLWLFRFSPDLLAERLTGVGKPDQKSWDKVLLAITAVAFFAWLTVTGFVLEKRVLRKELAGYDHYMRRLPYRLFPHVC